MNNELEQRAREICDKFCPRGNYEHDDVLDAIRAALGLGLVLAKPNNYTPHSQHNAPSASGVEDEAASG